MKHKMCCCSLSINHKMVYLLKFMFNYNIYYVQTQCQWNICNFSVMFKSGLFIRGAMLKKILGLFWYCVAIVVKCIKSDEKTS